MNKNNITKEQMAMVQNAMKNAKDILCKCGCDIFTQGIKLKKISKLLMGADEDILVPIQIFMSKGSKARPIPPNLTKQ